MTSVIRVTSPPPSPSLSGAILGLPYPLVFLRKQQLGFSEAVVSLGLTFQLRSIHNKHHALSGPQKGDALKQILRVT